MAMDRFEEDLQKVLNGHGKTLPSKVAFSLGMHVIEVSEYVQSYEYIHTHADMNASSLICGFGKGNKDPWDSGLVCRYTPDSKHKEYNEDLRKAHDGIIEFKSQDAHISAHSRRRDVDVLGYNLLQWLCWRVLWEINLKCIEHVNQQKSTVTANVPLLMSNYFPQICGTFNAASRGSCRCRVSSQAPRTRRRNLPSPKTPVLQGIILAEGTIGKIGDVTVLAKLKPQRKPLNRKVVSPLSCRARFKGSRKNSFCEDSNSIGLDNPTSVMLEVLQLNKAVFAQQQERLLSPRGIGRQLARTSLPVKP
ncbi:serine/threonine-protein kinase VRK1-like [Rhipicephalus sanguineus]|uniref:serine/threonine-protein kinase VRK1-like n=1 Tax=Rhipicephalus sanguineus TaxID=34632 RepID=UPI0018953FC1|nr:serine/threonine-protein kinase VRK1-like [Rhipicephalus sanguineus]